MLLDQEVITYGSPEAPIPVPMCVPTGSFEREYIAVALGRARIEEWSLTEPQAITHTRLIEKVRATGRRGAVFEFCFDVTVRQRRPMVRAVVILTDEMKFRLAPFVERLPEAGCFPCRWVLEAARGGELKPRGSFDVLAQVWHLHLEGVGTFMARCSQCERSRPAHSHFESRDLSVCVDCEAIFAVTDCVEKARRDAEDEAKKKQGREGPIGFNYKELLDGMHFPRRP